MGIAILFQGKPFRSCGIAGCDEPVYQHDFCSKHFEFINNPNIEFFPILKIDRLKFTIKLFKKGGKQ